VSFILCLQHHYIYDDWSLHISTPYFTDELTGNFILRHPSVEADSGAMGGSKSHEYQLISEIGEDTILRCTK